MIHTAIFNGLATCLAILTLLSNGTVVAQHLEQSSPQQLGEQQPINNEPPKLEKLSPGMRVVDRDWQYFSGLSCQQLAAIVAHSEVEQGLLAKRKRQCVKRYEAFLPQPVDQ